MSYNDLIRWLVVPEIAVSIEGVRSFGGIGNTAQLRTVIATLQCSQEYGLRQFPEEASASAVEDYFQWRATEGCDCALPPMHWKENGWLCNGDGA